MKKFSIIFLFILFSCNQNISNEIDNLENHQEERNGVSNFAILSNNNSIKVLDYKKMELPYIKNNDYLGYIRDILKIQEENTDKNQLNKINVELNGEDIEDFSYSGNFIYNFYYNNFGFQRSNKESCISFLSKQSDIDSHITNSKNLFFSNFKESDFLKFEGENIDISDKIGFILSINSIRDINNISNFQKLFPCEKRISSQESVCVEIRDALGKNDTKSISSLLKKKAKNDKILYLFFSYKFGLIDKTTYINRLCD